MNKRKLLNSFQKLIEIPQIFLIETQEQLAKDFLRSGVAVNEVNRKPESFVELLQILELELSSLSERNVEQFHQLLYAIDLPEEVINEFHKGQLTIQQLAQLIILREWKKVDFRNRYSDRM